MYIVTQFCFEAAPVIAWDKRIQAEGNRLPVYIGLPGLASLKALIGHVPGLRRGSVDALPHPPGSQRHEAAYGLRSRPTRHRARGVPHR